MHEPQYVGCFQRILGAQTCEEEQGHSRGTGYWGLIKEGPSTELYLAPLSWLCDTQEKYKMWVEDLRAETRVPVPLVCALASLKANKGYCVVMACFLLGEKRSKQFWHMDEVCLYSSWNDTIDPNSFGRFFRLFCTMQFSLILHKICLQTITVGDVPIWLLQSGKYKGQATSKVPALKGCTFFFPHVYACEHSNATHTREISS